MHIQIKRLLPLFLLVSCTLQDTTPKVIIQEGFSTTSTTEIITLPEIPLICPDEIIIIGEYMVIINNCHDKILQIVSLQDMQYKYRINRGNGPGELQAAYFTGHKSGDSLLIAHAPLYYTWINPSKLFHDSEYLISKVHDSYCPPQNMNVFQINSNWYYNDLEGAGFWMQKDHAGNIKSTTEFVPETSFSNASNNAYVYYTWTRYLEKQQIFVSALRYFPYIIFTDLQGNYSKIVQTTGIYQNPTFQNESIFPESETTIYNLGIQNSNHNLFLYNPGLKTGQSELSAQPTIEVYNLEGKPLIALKLNGLVGAIDYDLINGRAFGIHYNAEEERLTFAEIIIPQEFKHLFQD